MYTYDINMSVDKRTYHYVVRRTDDAGKEDVRTFEFLDVVDMFPNEVRTNVDALNQLTLHMSDLFS